MYGSSGLGSEQGFQGDGAVIKTMMTITIMIGMVMAVVRRECSDGDQKRQDKDNAVSDRDRLNSFAANNNNNRLLYSIPKHNVSPFLKDEWFTPSYPACPLLFHCSRFVGWNRMMMTKGARLVCYILL